MKKVSYLFSIAILASLFIFSSCEKEDPVMDDQDKPTSQMSIAEIASGNEDFSILVEALVKADLVEALDGDGSFTVFAPDNKAFEDLFSALGVDGIQDLSAEALTPILLYHVLGESYSSGMISEGYFSSLSPAQGRTVSMYIGTEMGVSINGAASVTTADIEARNGYIHVIDAVILPPTIVDIAAQNENFETLVAAVTAADLAGTLSDPTASFTVFAPVNAAFDALEELPADLSPILLYHVLGSAVFSDEISNSTVESLNSASPGIVIEVSDAGVKLNGSASVIAADIVGTNGVIHVIDKVLLPQ